MIFTCNLFIFVELFENLTLITRKCERIWSSAHSIQESFHWTYAASSHSSSSTDADNIISDGTSIGVSTLSVGDGWNFNLLKGGTDGQGTWKNHGIEFQIWNLVSKFDDAIIYLFKTSYCRLWVPIQLE